MGTRGREDAMMEAEVGNGVVVDLEEGLPR